MLLSLVTVISVFQLAIATNLNPPILYSRHAAQEGSLEKRETCEDGSRCLLGSCCGDGCEDYAYEYEDDYDDDGADVYCDFGD